MIQNILNEYYNVKTHAYKRLASKERLNETSGTGK